jgi:hypothetical protein
MVMGAILSAHEAMNRTSPKSIPGGQNNQPVFRRSQHPHKWKGFTANFADCGNLAVPRNPENPVKK